MSLKATASIAALATLLVAPGAYAMPMSGTMTMHVGQQNAQPLGRPDKLKIQETATGTNVSPGSPLDGGQVSITDVVVLDKGQGSVKGTITITAPGGTTTSPFTGTVATDAQGRVTAKGNFRTTKATGNFTGLKGSGTFSTGYTSKTDYTSEWKGEFTPPKAARR